MGTILCQSVNPLVFLHERLPYRNIERSVWGYEDDFQVLTRSRKETTYIIATSLKKSTPVTKLTDMPTELLLQIMQPLLPIDLLSLSRTCVTLRKILMHRNSVSTWKNSWLNLRHPDGYMQCSGDMSQPTLVNLYFGRSCHFCLHSKVTQALWPWRIRVCQDCIPIYFLSKTEVYLTLRAFDCLVQVASLLPHDRHSTLKEIYLRSEVEDLIEQFEDLQSSGQRAAMYKLRHEKQAHMMQRMEESLEHRRMEIARCYSHMNA